MIRAGIIGVSGYGGGELARILSGHPEAKLTYVNSDTYAGQGIGEALGNMRGSLDIVCQAYDPGVAISECDVLFLARHNGWAMKEAGRYLDAGLKIIDLSADFRLRDVTAYEDWYKLTHESPGLIEQAAYGLPELYAEDIARARLVANPGCYPTGAILAAVPLLSKGLIDPDTLVIDSKSGVSGAGRSKFGVPYHFPEANESMTAYNIGVHRHTPEIEQELSRTVNRPVKVSFTPHLIPITRGILTTVYAGLMGSGWSSEAIVRLYREWYEAKPFVVTLDAEKYPSTKHTLGSNYIHIGLKVDSRTDRVVVVSALDNLVKGMSGTAVQNMNLMFGLDQKMGLDRPGVFP